MKKVLLTLLIVIVAIGALATIGAAGYRMGYTHATISSGNGPAFDRPYPMDPDHMPMYRDTHGFGPRMMPYGYPMMSHGGRGGFGFFPMFHFLWNIAVLGLIIWFVYWLFTKSGWRITRSTGTDQNTPSSKTDG